jgi:hypothetical protein
VEEVAPVQLAIPHARSENEGVIAGVGRTDLAFVVEVLEDA